MKYRRFIAALLLLLAGMQTAWSQSMKVNLTDRRSVAYSLSEVENVTFYDFSVVQGHEYVDLGLPSGTLWASCNVGASSPEEPGDFFAWAETQPKDNYNWNSYKYSRYGFSGNFIRYTGNDFYRLVPEDDAASVNWGDGWEVPSEAQYEELIDENYTTIVASTLNEASGLLITSKSNGKSIFLPAAGKKTDARVLLPKIGNYWTHSCSSQDINQARFLYFYSTETLRLRLSVNERYYGCLVRPVLVKNPTPNYESVDLGLPSGTKWATCNVGSRTPEEPGYSFAWGETEPNRSFYSWSTYVHCFGTDASIRKYKLGTGPFELEAEDDAATALCGKEWQTPSKEQMDELFNSEYTTQTRTQQNEVYGMLITSKLNGNSIFLPNTIYRLEENVNSNGGHYWSRTLSTSDEKNGYGCYFYNVCQLESFQRASAISIRPVRVAEEHEYVDLGLPGGTLWATCNVGAETPEDYGEYFAWGEILPRDNFSWATYLYSENATYTSATMTKYNHTDGYTELLAADNVATVKWGKDWTMPCKEDFDELINPDNTIMENTILNGVGGIMITSKHNGNSIFFPHAGDYGYNGLEDVGRYGTYWSRTLSAENQLWAHNLLTQPGNILSTVGTRFAGRTIRPVRKP